MKETDPTNELLKYNSTENIINLDNSIVFPENYGIKKKYDNNSINKNDKDKNKKVYEYTIFNEFESIDFDGRNYVIYNLINDYRKSPSIPLDILLLRNQSLSFFEKNNNNFLNVSDSIFKEFKEYFKLFIKSGCVREAMKKNKRYENIITLINNDNIINKFLDDKHLKSIPLFEFAGSGYTNKDLLVSCVTGFPLMILGYDLPQTLQEYNNLKGIVILFNMGMKFITTLRELIIHLSFGYLNYLSEGKISNESPKKGNKISTYDGGLFFENLLFRNQYGDVTINDIIVILNGDCLNSLNDFQKNLRQKFVPSKFVVKSNLLKLLFKEYSIDLINLKNINNIYSTMKSSGSGLHIKRSIVIPSHSQPVAYNY